VPIHLTDYPFVSCIKTGRRGPSAVDTLPPNPATFRGASIPSS